MRTPASLNQGVTSKMVASFFNTMIVDKYKENDW